MSAADDRARFETQASTIIHSSFRSDGQLNHYLLVKGIVGALQAATAAAKVTITEAVCREVAERAIAAEREAAVVAGFKAGVWAHAVWKDGRQLVGVMGIPLDQVLAEIDARAGFYGDMINHAIRELEKP